MTWSEEKQEMRFGITVCGTDYVRADVWHDTTYALALALDGKKREARDVIEKLHDRLSREEQRYE